MHVFPLHKLPYGPLDNDEIGDGVMFCTYQSLIAQNKANERRLDQLVTSSIVAYSSKVLV